MQIAEKTLCNSAAKPPEVSVATQHSNFSSKAISKIIAEAEARKHLPQQCLGNFFASVIQQISVFALAILLAVFGSCFGNVVLFN